MKQAPNPNPTYDVVIVGGGPAGTALATLLQCDGHKCLLFEHSRFPRYHIGESLIPHTYGVLERLGLLGTLRASHFPAKHSVRFVSPSGTQSDPFYFSEVLPSDRARTWQVERSEFDQMCLDNARNKGVEVRTETKVSNVVFDNGRAVGVRVQPDEGLPYEVTARVVADASGRATVIGSQLCLKGPVPGLEKASYWSYYRGGKRGTGIDAGETTIFLIPERGWFWYIPLPNDIVSVGIVASPDYLFGATDKVDDAFVHEVRSCEALSERLASAERMAPVRGTRQLAYQNRTTCGDGWVMVGDARAFLDPIYSSGLYLALASAELAAGCVHEALEANDVSAARLGAFEPALLGGIEVIRRLIHAFYDQTFSFREFVERFPDQRAALIDCLVGDVVGKDMSTFLAALAQMSAPPPPLVS